MEQPPVRTLWWQDNALHILDQQALPRRRKVLILTRVGQVREAIRRLRVRGAPAIGVAAAYGVVLAAPQTGASRPAAIRRIFRAIASLRSARPTAYNLFFALERMETVLKNSLSADASALRKELLKTAHALFREDLDCCRRIGLHGSRLIRNDMSILTHCNAGGLATTGFGTALAPMFVAHAGKKRFHVFVDETRPVLQGARLTTWELARKRIPHTLITDNMAGWLMRRGEVDMIIVGADRIAANGDTANKIGTYSLAVLARAHGIPFYVAAPSSTFHPSLETGDAIPIEERSASEVLAFGDRLTAPEGTRARNPAFDVTPGRLVTAFITEEGILRRPFRKAIARLCRKPGRVRGPCRTETP